MASDDTEVRELIERWAKAVQDENIETIIAHHAADMVMFDVPPPNEVKGRDAYRKTWAPFFKSFGDSGVFEIDKLDVTAGDSVAFATALLRCGTKKELDDNPDMRLRLTVGLRKEHGRWTIAHEHHSFPANGK